MNYREEIGEFENKPCWRLSLELEYISDSLILKLENFEWGFNSYEIENKVVPDYPRGNFEEYFANRVSIFNRYKEPNLKGYEPLMDKKEEIFEVFYENLEKQKKSYDRQLRDYQERYKINIDLIEDMKKSHPFIIKDRKRKLNNINENN